MSIVKYLGGSDNVDIPNQPLEIAMQTTSRTVLVMGANGRFGSAAVAAFAHAGWQVVAHSRSAAGADARNVRVLHCDALDTRAVLEACAGGVDVIVNALSPQYTDWSRVAPMAQSVQQVAHETGALLMLPGNLYNFGRRLPPELNEVTPQHGDTPKATIRIALERDMEAAAATGSRSVVIRAGDFISDKPGTWIDMVIGKQLRQGRFTYPGPLDCTHAWAYLPDLARVFVAVAEQHERLRPFEVFHYAGLSLSGTELRQACERVTGVALREKHFPWWLMRLISPFSPMMRALLEMRYLWQRPHRLSQGKLAALLGEVPQTGIDQVLRETLPTAVLATGQARAGDQLAH